MIKPTHFLLIIFLLKYNPACSQAEGGVERYSYPHDNNQSFDNVIYIQSAKKWYAEIRYNFAGTQNFSLYLGKTMSGGSNLSYSFTPLLGGVRGQFNGISTGLKMDLGYKAFFFSSQLAYSFSTDHYSESYYYNWSELCFQAIDWLHAGVSIQETHVFQTKRIFEPGLVVGLSFRQFSLPLYCFRPASKNRYFIVGFYYEWKYIRWIVGPESWIVKSESWKVKGEKVVSLKWISGGSRPLTCRSGAIGL